MTQAHLRLVADNTLPRRRTTLSVTPAAAVRRVDFRKAWGVVRLVWGWLVAAVLLAVVPLRVCAFVLRCLVRAGAAFLDGLRRFVLGVIGLVLVSTVVYGLAHVLFYPLFHR